jgi:hypothetical protein
MDIPEELQFRDVRKQTPVIISKESRQILPQNGTRFFQGNAGSTQIVFRLPNEENSSTDLSTMWITADLQFEGLDAAAFTANNCNAWQTTNFSAIAAAGAVNLPFVLPCDSIESCIRQIHILINGSEAERFDYYNYTESMLNFHTNNSNFSNSIGAGCMLMNLSPWERVKLFLGNATAARTATNKIQVSFPLRWCGLSNLRSLVPTYLLGGGQSAIEIRLFLENANNYICGGEINFAATSSNPATFRSIDNMTANSSSPTYVLDNVRLNYDVVQTTDAYTSSLRSYLASNQLTLPIDTYYSTVFDLPTTQGWSNFTISTQMSDISAVFIGFVRKAEQGTYAFCSTDRFWKPQGLEEARLQINGKPYPNVNIRLSNTWLNCEAEAYHYLMKALRQNCSLEVIGNANAYKESQNLLTFNAGAAAATATSVRNTNVISPNGMYYGTNKTYWPTLANGIFTPNLVIGNAITATNVFTSDAHFADSPSQFILGFDISKSNYNNEYELSGQDLTKSSGLIQVNLKFSQNPSDFQAIVLVKHKRILDIGLDSSQIIY